MEADPAAHPGRAELIGQADELIVLVDSSEFRQRSSLILCGLERIATVITDDGIDDARPTDAGNGGRDADRRRERRRQGRISTAALSRLSRRR